MEELLPELLAWLTAHPGLAGLMVFLISFGESLLVVGMFILGTPIVLMFGVLVGLGAMPLWQTLWWAFLGAVLGDNISFWIGRLYKEQVKQLWPFNKHPEWLDQAEQFFYRHGGKSVAFGRFFGPVRSFIPTVAGMLEMTPIRFMIVEVISALLWAPLFIFPGVILGASLTLVAGVATRLIILLALIIGSLWLAAWLIRRFYTFVSPSLNLGLELLLIWLNKHPLLKSVTRGILDTNHPHILALLELSITLILTSATLLLLFLLLLANTVPFVLDSQVFYLFKSLRSPWADHIMIFINELHNLPTTLAVAFSGALYLFIRQQRQALFYWLVIIFMGFFSAWVMQKILYFSIPDSSNVYILPKFADIQITVSTVIYGFLAVLMAGAWKQRIRGRRLPYTLAAWWVISLVIARLYLAQQWLSDALLGFVLGLFWVALIGLAYRRHRQDTLRVRYLLLMMLSVFMLVNVRYLNLYYAQKVPTYSWQPEEQNIQIQYWLSSAWTQQTIYRTDWGGRRVDPMTIQWAGDLSALENKFLQLGWQKQPELTTLSAIKWLSSDSTLQELPLLPQVHDSQHDEFALVFNEDTDHRLVLRLWRANTYFSNAHSLLWQGNISREHLSQPLSLFSLPVANDEVILPADFLPKQLCWQKKQRHLGTANPDWQGQVMLGWAKPCNKRWLTTDD